MALKFLAVLMCLAVVKDINGAIVQGPNSCNLKVQQLRTELSQVAREAGLSISSVASAISSNIAVARLNIKIPLIDLKNKANLASGPNVGLCRRNLNLELAQLNDQGFYSCYYNAEINLLNQKVNQINNLKGVASQICSLCGADVACVDANTEDVSKQAAQLKQDISVQASAVQEKSAQCTQSVESSQLEIVNKASENFDACIAL